VADAFTGVLITPPVCKTSKVVDRAPPSVVCEAQTFSRENENRVTCPNVIGVLQQLVRGAAPVPARAMKLAEIPLTQSLFLQKAQCGLIQLRSKLVVTNVLKA
jgi:hypothetical protein